LQLYHSETLELMLQRWSKLERDFRMKNGRYDISKIPDIYDCIKYDSQHNASVGLEDTLELFRLSRALADIEYGISNAEKLDIAQAYCGSLEDLSQDQTDDAPPVTELINLQRRSPMIRNRKTGSMEVLSETSPNHTSKGCPSHRLFQSSSRQSPEIKPTGGLGQLLNFNFCCVKFVFFPRLAVC
ncbi:hypothetical protein XENOCAPTIV_021673, partial [Xenoophorus captivus]